MYTGYTKRTYEILDNKFGGSPKLVFVQCTVLKNLNQWLSIIFTIERDIVLDFIIEGEIRTNQGTEKCRRLTWEKKNYPVTKVPFSLFSSLQYKGEGSPLSSQKLKDRGQFPCIVQVFEPSHWCHIFHPSIAIKLFNFTFKWFLYRQPDINS